MSELQLPESDEYSVNSGDAFDNLRQCLPKHWKINPLRDQLSGIEYGQDWLVLMTNEKKQINGREFRIQSKVIQSRTKVTARRIGTKMKVSTLNNLRQTTVPVMLHFFDSNAQCGYWMWLDDWYDTNYSPSLESKKEISVYIPRKNKLDENTVNIIRQYIDFVHERAVLLKQAMAASRRDPDYEYRTSFASQAISVGVYAKHKDARPINFSITATAIDTDALKRLEERGESISFRALVHLQTELPQFVTPPDQEMELTLYRRLEAVHFPASIEFTSINSEHNYKIPFVGFDLVQEGSKYRKFTGTALQEHLLCTLEVDKATGNVSCRVTLNPEKQSIRSFKTYFEFIQYASTFNHVHLTSLEPLGNAYADIPAGIFPEFSSEENLGYRLTKALIAIEDSTGIKFNLPKKADPEIVDIAETIAEVVSAGFTSRPMSEVNSYASDRVLIVTTDVATADKMRSDLQESETIPCWYKFPEPVTAKVLKHKINLGMGAYIFTAKKILEFESFPSEVTEANKDERISFPIEVEWSATITAFKDWLPDDNELGVDWAKPMD